MGDLALAALLPDKTRGANLKTRQPRGSPFSDFQPRLLSAPATQLGRLPCACGGGCPRCQEAMTSQASADGVSTLASKQRPEVVVEPKTELETAAFRDDPFLVQVMRGKRLLSFGAVGNPVRLVQEALLASEVRRPTTPATRLPKFGIDGIFGPETKAAVEDFQTEYGLAVDGIVGQQTLYWLDQTFKDYPSRPGPAADHKLAPRFPGELPPSLQKPSSLSLTMKVDRPVTADTTAKPRISTSVSFTATFAGSDGKVFFVQNIRRMERKVYWQRTSDCTSRCEQARAFVGKAQGLDTSLPYAGPKAVTDKSQTLEADDSPEAEADEGNNPQGDFKAGDVVYLFAHDEFRMFLAFGPASPIYDFSVFDSLAFIDWEWKGKTRFAFDGKTWSAGSVESRTDPTPASTTTSSNALIFLGPLYLAEEVDRNLRSESTTIDEKPDDW